MPAVSPTISIILPVFNEADSLAVLWRELDATLGTLALPAEIVVVDDGSTDDSADVVRALMAHDPRIRLVRFARNAGLSAAFHAGLTRARGDVIVTMDSDLQSDPDDIPRLLARLKQADAVVGWRRCRRDPWLKRISSTIANAIRAAVTGDEVRDSACSLRVMRRACRDALPPFSGMHRFVPTLLKLRGHRVVEAEVNHRPRRFGRSAYGIRNRALTAFVDLLAIRWSWRSLRYAVADGDPSRDASSEVVEDTASWRAVTPECPDVMS